MASAPNDLWGGDYDPAAFLAPWGAHQSSIPRIPSGGAIANPEYCLYCATVAGSVLLQTFNPHPDSRTIDAPQSPTKARVDPPRARVSNAARLRALRSTILCNRAGLPSPVSLLIYCAVELPTTLQRGRSVTLLSMHMLLSRSEACGERQPAHSTEEDLRSPVSVCASPSQFLPLRKGVHGDPNA
ncbi:uncharacterized protein BP5553_06404 [Venustampulla echinocandica]|uniref:Uncharacterized protein n=1 Tax=Venustampulla echinocandica TaxID=2656787 RepID=A0A370TJU0_9HELO|nr:uncharacterized protein BP5553_06404 [Venustampulla echinocandica]RDL35792.1 hypothetical protein BP5553_06404 [Venustampulla echinocandica]